MQTDKSGHQGPRSSREPFGSSSSGSGGSRFRQPERNDRNDRDNGTNNTNVAGAPPAVPGFGFQFPMMPNGMPMFPPGFVMPGQAPSQPPPPGAS